MQIDDFLADIHRFCYVPYSVVQSAKKTSVQTFVKVLQEYLKNSDSFDFKVMLPLAINSLTYSITITVIV